MPSIELLATLLRVAKGVSSEIPVPGLSTALEIALHIVEKAKDIQDTQNDCRALAERAAYFSLGVYDQLKQCGGQTESIAAREHVQLLLCTLNDIEGLMTRRHKKRFLSFKFLRKQADVAKEVVKLRAQLEDAIRLFMIQTGVNIEHRMDVLLEMNVRVLQHVEDSARVGDLVLREARGMRHEVLDLAQRLNGNATFDGTLRLFARENLDFLEPAYAEVSHNDPGTQRGHVIRYRAMVRCAGELTGTQVVAHMYSHRHNRLFVQAVNSSRQSCGPHILAVLGYSRCGDSGADSYIVTEDYTSSVHYLNSQQGIKRLQLCMQVMAELCMVARHLSSLGICISRDIVLGFEPVAVGGSSLFFPWGSLVFVHSGHGSCLKWAPYSGCTSSRCLLEDRNVRHPYIPTAQEGVMRLIDDYRHVCANASAEAIARRWLSRLVTRPIASPMHNSFGGPPTSRIYSWTAPRSRCKPRSPLGSLQGRSRHGDVWTSLPVRNGEAELGLTTSQEEPLGFSERICEPRPPGGLLGLFGPSQNPGVDYELGISGTRWKRFEMPRPSTRLKYRFQQCLDLRDDDANISRLLRSAPILSAVGFPMIRIAVQHKYSTESTLKITKRRTPLALGSCPLWVFFYIQRGDAAPRTSELSVPLAFWSLEKEPTSIPKNIVLSQSTSKRHFVWTQVLGNLSISIRASVKTQFVELDENDMVAFRKLQENCISTCHPVVGKPEAYATSALSNGGSASRRSSLVEKSDGAHAIFSEWSDAEDDEEDTDREY